ncbi:MAG: DNA-3-methyladenine glycosylase I [Bacteroidota bacterium]|nr:DNA-3-methyladenine glycosylase I [Bacteroidota bacterium]
MDKNKRRCSWFEGDTLNEQYHDHEWGVPIYDDLRFFEFLTLETFQAGLSWITILQKRENFKKAFNQFDYEKVAYYGDEKIKALLNNKGIVRNKLKIKATINNAQRFIAIRKKHRTFSRYIWAFVGGKPLQNTFKTLDKVPAKTLLSEIISKDLSKNGFKFVGPTIIYSLMQASGIVNDHLLECYRYVELNNLIRKANHHPAHQ